MPRCFYCLNEQHFFAERTALKNLVIRVDIHCADSKGVWLESEGSIHAPGQVLVQSFTYKRRESPVTGTKIYGCGSCGYRWVHWDRPFLRLTHNGTGISLQVPNRDPKSPEWFATPEGTNTYKRGANRTTTGTPTKPTRKRRKSSRVPKRKRVQLGADQKTPLDSAADADET